MFYWTSFKNFTDTADGAEAKNVSILVLLDFIQKPEVIAAEIFEEAGFNPCFIGLHSKTTVFALIGGNESTFQSLFYWTSFKNYGSGITPAKLWRVSILVLLDFIQKHVRKING